MSSMAIQVLDSLMSNRNVGTSLSLSTLHINLYTSRSLVTWSMCIYYVHTHWHHCRIISPTLQTFGCSVKDSWASPKPIVVGPDQVIWEEKDHVEKMELLVHISDVQGEAIRELQTSQNLGETEVTLWTKDRCNTSAHTTCICHINNERRRWRRYLPNNLGKEIGWHNHIWFERFQQTTKMFIIRFFNLFVVIFCNHTKYK